MKATKIGVGHGPKGAGNSEALALNLQVREMQVAVQRQREQLAERESQLRQLTLALGDS